MQIDLSRARIRPYAHQLIGVQKLVEYLYFALFDEMGAGKTKQVIDSAQVLATLELINRVIVVAPAAVRAVWFDPELGELVKHLWVNFPCNITEFHARLRSWGWFTNFEGKKQAPKLEWIITNYDFIRSSERRVSLLKSCTPKTLLVLDESSAVKGWKTKQTKACEELREHCGRVILLNGTPIANSPGDLYSQARIMDPKILGCRTYFHFRARYARMGGWQGKQIVGWHDIEDLQKRMAPYVLRRLKKDCIDLPAKIPSVTLTTTLDPATWRLYKEMRDDMVAWLSESTASSAAQAIVKVIRLAQITSGFLGGVQEEIPEEPELPLEEPAQPKLVSEVQPIGREKLDTFLTWLDARLEEDPRLKLLVWARFRPEVQRLYDELGERYPQMARGLIWGGQNTAERNAATRLLDPTVMPVGPVTVIGTPQTGSMGLNLVGAHTVFYMSNDFSLKTRLQSEDRTHRPGQTYPVSYFDLVAEGPQGQKTVDHKVVKALQSKEDLANLTTSAWISILAEE